MQIWIICRWQEYQYFEKTVAKTLGVKHCIALTLEQMHWFWLLHSISIKKNDEVITVPNSFIATVASIIHIGAKPVFVDVKNDQNIDTSLIEKKSQEN